MSALLMTLRKARHLLAGGWHATVSLDTAGYLCHPRAEMVQRFSLHDAIEVCAPDVEAIVEAEGLLTVLAEPGHRRTLYDWEMEPTRAPRDVLALFDRGITRAAMVARRGGRA